MYCQGAVGHCMLLHLKIIPPQFSFYHFVIALVFSAGMNPSGDIAEMMIEPPPLVADCCVWWGCHRILCPLSSFTLVTMIFHFHILLLVCSVSGAVDSNKKTHVEYWCMQCNADYGRINDCPFCPWKGGGRRNVGESGHGRCWASGTSWH